MIQIENVLISDDVVAKQFVCDLQKCQGACCVEGDLGAPLDEEELPLLEECYEAVRPYLSDEGISAIEDQGVYVQDWEGEYSTPTVDDSECAYAVYGDDGILKCGIEQAYKDGKTQFRKPISCFLYPIRVRKLKSMVALNYDKWDICHAACVLGEQLQVPVYKFVKDALIERFGQGFYDQLEAKANEVNLG